MRTLGTAVALLVVVVGMAACREPADERSAPTSTGSTTTAAPMPTVTVPPTTTTTPVALGDSDCADARATRYLVDLIVPEPGARC